MAFHLLSNITQDSQYPATYVGKTAPPEIC